MAKNGPAPKIDDCSESMRIAFKQLADAGHKAATCSEHQLKVGDLNFWPVKGTIQRDGHRALPQKGVDAFIDLLNDQNVEVCYLKPPLHSQTSSPSVSPVKAHSPGFSAFSPLPNENTPLLKRKMTSQPEMTQDGKVPLRDWRPPSDFDSCS